MMIIFCAFKDAQDQILKSEYALNDFSKKSKHLQNFQNKYFLQLDQSNFSISFNLHMSSMNTLLYS